MGLFQVPGQPCIFTDYNGIIVFFYVDDLVMIFPINKRARALDLLKELTQAYEFRVMGELGWFLGVKVSRDRLEKKLWLSQESYFEKICREFGCEIPGRKVCTPIVDDQMSKYDGSTSPDQIKLYQKKVGSLIYASTVTRPDISRAVSHLAEFMTNPGPHHMKAIDHLLFYISQSKDLCIEYSGSSISNILHCSADAAFGNSVDRRSVQGFVFKLFNGPVHWNSCKQSTVTTSSTEAELLSLCNASKELVWMHRLFSAIGFKPDQEVEIFNDNIQTLRLLTKEDPIIETRLRHVDIYQHWLRERVQLGEIKVAWIGTNDSVADGMTKALSKQKHNNFLGLLNLVRKLKIGSKPEPHCEISSGGVCQTLGSEAT